MTSPNSGVYIPPPGRGGCSSNKVGFFTRRQAKTARGKLHRGAVGIYRCPECDRFHLGHKPDRVRNGELDKDDWLRAKGNA